MIYVSTSCVRSDYIKNSVRELAEMGFTNIELSGGTRYYEGYLEDLLFLKKELGLSYQVHNYFPPPPPGEDFVLNLIATDEGNYLRSTEMIRSALGISKTLGAASYAFHPGYTVDISPRKKGAYFDYKGVECQDKGAWEKIFYERFEVLLSSLPVGHTPIAIENLFPFEIAEDFSLFSRPEEITGFLKRYKERSDVGLLLDLGHVNVSSHYFGFNKVEFVERLLTDFPEKILSLHLSENDGRGDKHFDNEEGSWQLAILKQYRSLFHDVAVTLEWSKVPITEETMERYEKIIALF